MARKNGDGESLQGGSSATGSGSSSAAANTNTRLRAKSDPFLYVCRCFRVITALTAVLCIAVNVLSAIRNFTDGSNIFDGIFRCYAVLLALFVAVAETEWNFIIKFWKVLDYWVGRGMLQIFVAVMTRAFPDTSNEHAALIVLENVASYMLLACGVLYVILGILCIGCLKRSRQKKELSTGQAIKDLEDLERRREELQALLVQESV